jgi:uncharacterized OsmC-like protein
MPAQMNNETRIKEAFERSARAMMLRPALGQVTAVTRVRVREGLICDVEEGSWKLTADLSEKHGGADAGPNPGTLGRAALGCCLAMGYVRWAAKLGIPLSNVEIEVQADFDARGEYGVADLPPGYEEVRYVVTIESDAPEADVRHLLDIADAHASYLDVFSRAQDVRRVVRIVTPSPASP